MATETLKIKIGLNTNSSVKYPKFTIGVNNVIYVADSITKVDPELDYFEFKVDVEEGTSVLEVSLLNKEHGDTQLTESGDIVKDMLLNIKSIEIEDIALDSLLWTHSEYTPIYDQSYLDYCKEHSIEVVDIVKNCVNLGWNGTWKLQFESPFFVWLLENF